MANWIFDANDVEEREFAPIPEGNHRVRVLNVEEQCSRTQKQMLKLTLEVSGYSSKVWDYLVFDGSDEAARKRTNTKINQIAQSFGVNPNAVVQQMQLLIGKVGGVRIKHDNYNGEVSSKVSYYLDAKKTAELPPWKNAGSANAVSAQPINDFEPIGEDFMEL